MDNATLKLALTIFKQDAKEWAEYEASCAEYAAQGYRPSHCFHGTSLWTDYDPMCGPCEDGFGYFDPNAYRRLALDRAQSAYAVQNERIDALVKLQKMGAPVDLLSFSKWVTEPVQQYIPKAEQKQGYAALAAVEVPF